jgi:multidrug efflux pump subunit AcrA (membrane-fusion protein)
VAITFSSNRVATVAAGPTVTPLVIQLPTDAPVSPTPSVLSTRLASRAVAFNVKATGTLASAKQASLSFAITGRVKEINVEEGAKVKTGTVIASLDTGSLESTVAQANAAFELAKASFVKVRAGPNADEVTIAKANLDRAKAAVDQAQAAYDRIGGASNPASGLTVQALTLQQATITFQSAVASYNLAVNRPTEVELGLAAAQLAQAQAALEAAKTTLANARIIAPFDGTVLNFNPKIGESIASNAAVATVADLTKMQVVVSLDENSLVGIKLGQSVNLTVDALGGKTLTGKVRKIGLLGTAATGVVSVPVTIDIDPTDAPIYPGLSATVEFQAGQ